MKLRGWIEEATGGRVEALERRPGGGRRQAWSVTIRFGDERVPGFLRYDPSSLKPWDPYSLRREAEVYRALAGTAVPVAEVLAVHPEEQAVLLSAMAGDARFSTIGDPGVEQRLMDELCDGLVALHALDSSSLDLPTIGSPRTIREHLLEELDVWESLYRHDAAPDPLLTAAFVWLRAHLPPADGAPSLVQGDTGPGNFMHHEGRLTAFVDWEFAHLGDPVEDLAWVSVRSVQEPPPDLPGFFRRYSEKSGRKIDDATLRTYQLLIELRIGVLYARSRSAEPQGGEVGNGLAFAALHRILLAETLARVTGCAVAPLDEPEPPAPQEDWLFREALGQLKDVVLPAVDDPFARLRTKGVARLVKYFRGVARYRDDLRERTRRELEAAIGSTGPDLDAARGVLERRLASGELPVAEAAPLLLREVQREVRMMADVMGSLATRRYAVP